MNKPGLYLCVYSGNEYLVNVQGLMPCMRITSILDLNKFKSESKFSGSKVLIKEIEENLDQCTFRYVTFNAEVVIEQSQVETTVTNGNLNGYQIEKYKQYYLTNGCSENKLQVFIMKDLNTTATIARGIASEIKVTIKKGN